MTSTSTGHPLSLARKQYPDPFLDIASTRLPKSRKKLLELCYLFSTTHPQIAPIVRKLSKYPITKLIITSENGQSSMEDKWRDILEDDMNIYEIAESVGLDFFGYGNCFLIVHKPFIRAYECQNCGHAMEAGKVKYYIKRDNLYGKCNNCNTKTRLEAKDEPVKTTERLNLVRLKPQNMYIRRNELTGQATYYYDVPEELKKAVANQNPDREYIDSTPWPYVEAALNDKKIKFHSSKILHLKEPSLSGDDMNWGNPIVLPALKDAYLNQIYKKADESAANERSLPVRFVYPSPNSGEGPLQTISLSKFTNFLEESLNMWRHDKNAVLPVPFPVETSQVGGDAKRFATAELRQLAVKEIIGSTGVPQGFLSDKMSWSGGSVQLRMLENMLMSYLRALDRMLKFAVDEVAKLTNIPRVSVRFKPFKMADDTQKLQLVMRLAEAKQVSYKEVLQRLDLNWDDQHEQVIEEIDKIQDLDIQEQLTQAKASLRAAEMQSEQQFRGEGLTELKENVIQDSEATARSIQDNEDFDEVDQAMEQQQHQENVEQQKLEEMHQKAEIGHQQGLAQKYDAEAKERATRSEVVEDQMQAAHVPQVVKTFAKEVQNLPPEERNGRLQEIAQEYPELAKKVEERVEMEEERSGIPQEVQEEEQQIEQLIAQLKEEAKNPSQFADQVMMADKEVRGKILNYLKENDPQLLQKVVQAMDLVNDQPSRIPGGSS